MTQETILPILFLVALPPGSRTSTILTVPIPLQMRIMMEYQTPRITVPIVVIQDKKILTETVLETLATTVSRPLMPISWIVTLMVLEMLVTTV